MSNGFRFRFGNRNRKSQTETGSEKFLQPKPETQPTVITQLTVIWTNEPHTNGKEFSFVHLDFKDSSEIKIPLTSAINKLL